MKAPFATLTAGRLRPLLRRGNGSSGRWARQTDRMPLWRRAGLGPTGRASRRRQRLRRALRSVIDAVPGTARTTAGVGGALAAGPAGALVAPMASATAIRFLRWTHLDQMFLSTADGVAERERTRAKLTFDTAMTGIVRLLDAGESLRGDGFWGTRQNEDGAPPAAEQILEGVLRAACETHEHRKAERLGELFVYIASHDEISIGHANRLLELAKKLTYQELLLLGLFYEPPEGLPNWIPSGMFTRRETGIVMAIAELARLGLLTRMDHGLVSSWAQINPGQMRTVLDGRVLVEAMSLTAAEQEDWDAINLSLGWLGVVDADAGTTSLEAVIAPGADPAATRVKIDKRVVRFEKQRITLEDLPENEQQ